jgi:predicted CoA-substrate-specific enzyme activase
LITAGIDGGSRAVKVVLWDTEAGAVRGTALRDQGVDHDGVANALLDEVLEKAGVARSGLGPVVATGYARKLVRAADRTVTEITCHAAGVRHVLPEARSVVEIGGQDSKVLRLGPNGTVLDFSMNDRCAAGTGRFLEVLAVKLETPLAELGALAARSDDPAAISSMCVVFAETEIIGLLASGTAPARHRPRRPGRHGPPGGDARRSGARGPGRLHRRWRARSRHARGDGRGAPVRGGRPAGAADDGSAGRGAAGGSRVGCGGMAAGRSWDRMRS